MSETPTWRARLWLALALGLTAYKLWLTRGQSLYAIGEIAAYDRHYLELAQHLVHGSWLGDYDALTLSLPPFYALFIAAVFAVGLPLALAQQALYAAACGAFARGLRPAIPSGGARTAIYALLVWNPMTFDAASLGRVLRQHVEAPLVVLIFAGLAALYLRRDQPARRQAGWSVLLGLAAGAYYLTQENMSWLLPAGALLAGVVLRDARRQSHAALRRSAGQLALAGLVAVLPVLAVSIENQRNYGWFGTCELRAGEFRDTWQAMRRVASGPTVPDVPVTRAARAAMAAASPRFAEVERQLADETETGWAGSIEFRTRRPVAAGEVGGGVITGALRAAAARAGRLRDAGQTKYFYKHLAQELEAALDGGHLPDDVPGPRWLPSPSRVLQAADFVVSFSRFSARPPPSTGTPDQLNLFRDMTGERLSPPAGELDVVGAAEYLQNVAKVDRLQLLGKALRPALLTLALVALVVAPIRAGLALRRRQWTFPLTLAAAAALGVLVALLRLAGIDAVECPVLSIPACAPLYPLVLVFVIAVIWDAIAAWQARRE